MSFLFYFIFKLYNIVLVLPNIEMNPPQVYLCSPSWTLLPPPSPNPPTGSSQCTSPKHPVSCIEPETVDVLFLNEFIWTILCIYKVCCKIQSFYNALHLGTSLSEYANSSPKPLWCLIMYFLSFSVCLGCIRFLLPCDKWPEGCSLPPLIISQFCKSEG